MTLTEMRYIVALARERHFGKAAEACHVSQPTLSVALKKVEGQLGAALFERTASDVRITALGERIVAQARRVLEEAVRLEEIAGSGGDPMAGPLRVGVIYTIAPYLLPQLIPALHRHAAAMPLFLKEDFTGNLIPALKAGELDVIVIALPFAEPGLVAQPVYEEPFRVVVPAAHPWVGRPDVSAEELDGQNLLLLGQGNCFRDQVLGACPQVSSPETDIRLGHSIGTIRCMVASGLGVSVLPDGALQYPYSNDLISVVPFAPPAPARRIALAWRAGFVRPNAIDALLSAVRGLHSPAYRLLV